MTNHKPVLPTPVDPHDVLALDSLVNEEDVMIRDTVRTFVEREINPHVGEWFDSATIPHKELASQLGSLGLFGMHLTGYGCAGTSASAYGHACTELEAGDSGIRSFVSVQGSLAMFPIWAYGSEEQKQEWLPAMAAGDAIGCFGLTEADSGSDPSSMRTFAKRDGDDWILNGSKMWITNGSVAQVAVVWAQTDDGVRGFVVPTNSPGFSAPEIKQKMSLRASVTSELVFSNVRLPASAVLPNIAGMRGPLSCLNEARYGILFGAVGAARACYEEALAYAGDRVQFGKPISALQLTQQKLVNMMVSVQRGMLLAIHIGNMKDAGALSSTHVSVGKLDNVRMALDVARTARSVLGANGISLEYSAIRHMNNLESVYTYEGTNEIHTLIVGNAITGQQAFHAPR